MYWIITIKATHKQSISPTTLLDKICFMFTRTNNDGLNNIEVFSDEQLHRSLIVL